jgi:excisionase family DNA binding protein
LGFSGLLADLAYDFGLGIAAILSRGTITTKAMASRFIIPQKLPIDFFYIDHNICLILNGSAMVSQASSSPSLLVKPDEAAKLLAVSPRTLWSLTRDGVVPCVRFGKSVRYSMDTLRAVIAQRENRQLAVSNGHAPDGAVLPLRDNSNN